MYGKSYPVQGEHMMLGCQLVDYLVEIGASVCTNADLTDNQLDCRPVKVEPRRGNDSFCNDALTVAVNILAT